jgi:hypothetical protein
MNSSFKNNFAKALLLITIFVSPIISIAQDFRILKQISLDENSSISTLKYGRNEFGIGILNNKGIMTNEQKFNLSPKDIGIMGDNIFLIAAKMKNGIKITGYSALLFNKKSLAPSGEQELITKQNSSRISSTLLKDPLNNLHYVLLRETKYNDGFSFFGPSIYDTKFLESESIQLLSFNNKLESRPIEIKTEAINAYFADACSDVKKNIYLCSFTKDAIMIEKFDSTGKFLSKLTSPFSVWKNPSFDILMNIDKSNQQSVIIVTKCLNQNKKMAHNVKCFDFANNKVIETGEILLNKDYCRALKSPNEEAKGKNFSSIEDLKPVQIFQDSARVIVENEILYDEFGGKDNPTEYNRRGSIITVYNKKNFEVVRDILIDKRFGTFVEQSEGINAHLVGNNLYAVTCEGSGLKSYKTYVYKINLTSGEVIKNEIEKEDVGKGKITFPSQVAWFKNKFAVPFFGLTTFTSKTETVIILRSY